jgi:hypothetical protein
MSAADNSCVGKVVHATLAEAEREAARLSAETGEDLEAYKCRFCEGYHVGHRRFQQNPVEGRTMASNSNPAFDDEGQERETQAPDIGTLAVLNKSEIDQQIATARRYPRSIVTFRKEALQLATLDEQTAAECIYALPRDGKTIEGPSARFAEIINYAWGNTRAGARVVSEGEEFITAQGLFYDLEKNTAISYEVQRRIVDKRGNRFKVDMIGTTGNAACSVALRNAILKGVPKALWKPMYDSARKVVAGDVRTLANRRDEAIKAFAIFGVKPEQIFATLNVQGIQDITIDHLVALKGLHTAIQDGDTTPEQAFARPDTVHVNAGNASQSTVDALRNKYATSSEGATGADPRGTAPDPSAGQDQHDNPATPPPGPPRDPAPTPQQSESFDPQKATETILENNRRQHGRRRGVQEDSKEQHGQPLDFNGK